MKAMKFNRDIRAFELYKLPSGECLTFDEHMHRRTVCAKCGKMFPFDEMHTSCEIFNEKGFGFMVCDDCCYEEFKREREYLKCSR